MSEPSKQDHWVRLAVELGLPVPEGAVPQEGIGEPSSGSAQQQAGPLPEPEGGSQGVPGCSVSVSSSPSSAPGVAKGPAQRSVAKGPATQASLPSGPIPGPNHWLELAKQLGLEVPPEMGVRGAEPTAGPEPTLPSPAEKTFGFERPQERGGRKSDDKKLAIVSGEEERPFSAQPGDVRDSSEAGVSFEGKRLGSDLRQKKHRRKKHRWERPGRTARRGKPLPASGKQFSQSPEEEYLSELSEEFVEEDAFCEQPEASREGAEVEKTIPTERQGDEAQSFDLWGKEPSVEPEGPSVGPTGIPEGPSEVSATRGTFVPMPNPTERLAAGKPEWMQKGADILKETELPSGLGKEEAVLLPPSAEAMPGPLAVGPSSAGPLGPEEPTASGTGSAPLPSSESPPADAGFLDQTFLEPDIEAEDLFETSELQEDEEDYETEPSEGKTIGPSNAEKEIHRGVPTWKEVMDLIISTNQQARSRRGDRPAQHGRGGPGRTSH